MISPRGVEVSSTLSIMSSVLYMRSAAFCVIWRQSSAYIRHAAPSGWNCSVASLPFRLRPIPYTWSRWWGLKACEQKPNILAFGTQRHPSIPR